MKKAAMPLVLLTAALALAGCASQGAGTRRMAGSGGPAHGSPAIYWCACGPDCTCNSVSTKPGKCACGKELAGGHVVFVEGNTALACTCGPTCACALDPKERTTCPCGKPLKRINLERTGVWFCNCGGSCGCNTVSDAPGRCAACGMELHQAP